MSNDYKYAKDLPIRAAAWKLFKQCDIIMMRIGDKDHKHTIGRDILNSSRLLLRLIGKANRVTNEKRYEALCELIDEYHDLADMIKYMAESNDEQGRPLLPPQCYIDAIPLLSNVERQASGWMNKTCNSF